MRRKNCKAVGVLLVYSTTLASCVTYSEPIQYLIDGSMTTLDQLIDDPEKYDGKPIEGKFYFSCRGDYFAFLVEEDYLKRQVTLDHLGYRFRFITDDNEKYCSGVQPKYFVGRLITTCEYIFSNCPDYYRSYIIEE
jgi:hypothetical protein